MSGSQVSVAVGGAAGERSASVVAALDERAGAAAGASPGRSNKAQRPAAVHARSNAASGITRNGARAGSCTMTCAPVQATTTT